MKLEIPSTLRELRFANIHRGRCAGLPIWLIALVAVALLLRSYGLDWKPPHFDEGINGHFVHEMWHDGFYRYDPTNFHGPLYFYYLQMTQLLLGDGIVAARFGTGLLSVASIVMIGLLQRFVGRAAIWAAVIVTLSTGFVFYSRYSIHESLFILLQILFTYGFLLWREERSRLSFSLMAVGVFGAFATKETFFIYFITWLIALVANRFSAFIPSRLPELELEARTYTSRPAAQRDDLYAIVVVVAMITIMLFTGFFMNEQGFVDMFRAYMFWTKTGVTGTGHEKPFFYWVGLLYNYEWPALLGLGLTPWVFFRGGRIERQFALVGFGTCLAYSIIPYKTPWCVLNLIWPLAIVVGFAVERGPKKIFVPLTVIALGASVFHMFRLNFKNYALTSEPYVYVQSTLEFKTATDLIYDQVRRAPEDLNMRILVLNRDTWPLPWMLQDFPHLEYGKAGQIDFDRADVILLDAQDRNLMEARLVGKFWVEPFQLRDSYDKGFAFFRYAKFDGLVPAGSAIYEKSELDAKLAPAPSAAPSSAPPTSSGPVEKKPKTRTLKGGDK